MILAEPGAADYNPRIVLIDNDENQLLGFSMILGSEQNFVVVNAYRKAEDAIRNLKKDYPDIIFIDIDLANEDSMLVIRKIKKFNPDLHIIALTDKQELNSILGAFSAGTSGYLLKSSDHLELTEAVSEIINNGAPMSPKVAKLVVSSFQKSLNSPLSARETEILTSLAMGKTYKITANNLHIGMETVKSHVKNIYSKLQVSTKTEAIDLARKRSLI
jgi:DNA-binding NarL/FixJ family response regulator